MFNANQITVSFGGETLFNEISFRLGQGDRVGLIGKNGAGKSTVLGLMAKVGIVNYTSLRKFRKYAIVIAFLSAAFLTPPDPFSQISLALPIILLYEISIYIAKIIQKNKKDD